MSRVASSPGRATGTGGVAAGDRDRIATIFIYIYPLKVVFGGMWYLLSDRRFGHAMGVQSLGQARAVFALYAVGFTAIAFEILLLNLRAWTLRKPLRLNLRERVTTQGE